MGRGKAQASLDLIEEAREILGRIQPSSVRAVCYQLFNAGAIPDMSKKSTNRVSIQLVYGRERGIIPWGWVVDETREAERTPSWNDPEDFRETVKRAYRRDRWVLQPRHVEVWSEKGTVRGTLAPILEGFGVTFRVLHGYGSATSLYEAAQEIARLGKPALILYVGDWDPSGMHMSQADVPERLQRYGGIAQIERAALNWLDVRDANLPGFDVETKRNDPRYRWFLERYGGRCWELDALDPVRLRTRVGARIEDEIEHAAWRRCGLAEAAEQESLAKVMEGWRSCPGA